VPLPPRGSVQSAILQEMVYRERVRLWKEYERSLVTEVWRRSGNEKDFENLSQIVTDIMRMSLHLEGAYTIRERLVADKAEERKTDRELLSLLDSLDDMPEF